MHFSQAQGVIFGVPRAGAGPDDPCGSHSDSGYSPPPPTWPPSRMCQKAPPLLSLSWALIGPMGARAAAGSGAPRPPAAGVRLPRQPGAGGARGPGAEGRAEPEPELGRSRSRSRAGGASSREGAGTRACHQSRLPTRRAGRRWVAGPRDGEGGVKSRGCR